MKLKKTLQAGGIAAVGFFAKGSVAQVDRHAQAMRFARVTPGINHDLIREPFDEQANHVGMTANQPYGDMDQQSCFAMYDPEACLKSALTQFNNYKLTAGITNVFSMDRGNSALEKTVIAPLKQFIESGMVKYSHPQAYEYAGVALMMLYQKAGKPTHELYSVLSLDVMNKYSFGKLFDLKLDAGNYIEKAMQSYHDESIFASERILKTASKDKNNGAAKLLEAAKLWKLGKTGTAEKYIKRALALNPEFEKFISDIKNNEMDYQTFKKKFEKEIWDFETDILQQKLKEIKSHPALKI